MRLMGQDTSRRFPGVPASFLFGVAPGAPGVVASASASASGSVSPRPPGRRPRRSAADSLTLQVANLSPLTVDLLELRRGELEPRRAARLEPPSREWNGCKSFANVDLKRERATSDMSGVMLVSLIAAKLLFPTRKVSSLHVVSGRVPDMAVHEQKKMKSSGMFW